MAVSDEPKKPAVSVKLSSAQAIAWLKANWPRYWEIALFAAIVAVAAGLRLWDLGARSFNHDESLHATYSWYLFNGQGYQHDPMMHGPFQFHFNAVLWKTLGIISAAPLLNNWVSWGVNDFTARLQYAMFGTALVALPFFFRSYIGRLGAFLAALFLTFSPVLLYFSRFARNDIIIAFFTLGIVICIWRYMSERRPRYLYLIAALLALSFATKETTFLTAAILLLFLDVFVAWELASGMRDRAESTAAAVAEPSPDKAATTRRARRKEVAAAPAKAAPQPLHWALVFLLFVPFAWFIAAAWPLIGKWRARWGLEKLPLSADLLLIVGTLAGVQFAAGVQLIPFVGGKDAYYKDPGVNEETLMKVAVFSFLVVSAYIGFLWRPRTWLICASIFYAIFVLLYTTFFSNIGGLTFAKDASGFWQGALGTLALLAFVGPSLLLLFSPNSPEGSPHKSIERQLTLAAGIGFAVFVVVFLFVLVDNGFWSGMWGSFDYWLKQQGVQRGSQPVYYYMMILPMYEFLPLVLAIIGAGWFLLRRQFLLSLSAVVGVCILIFLYFWVGASLPTLIPILVILGAALFAFRMDLFTTFLIFWAGASLIAYATAGEKMPWLTVNLTLPLIIIAAKFLNTLFERFRIRLPFDWRSPEILVLLVAACGALSMIILWLTAFSATGAVLAVLLGVVAAGLIARAVMLRGTLLGAQAAVALLVPALFIITVRDSFRANFQIGDWPREILSYADTSPDLPMVRDRIVAAGIQSGLGNDYPVSADNEIAWPMVWYFRNFNKVTWSSGSMTPPISGSIVLLKIDHQSWMDPYLDDYDPPISIRHLWWFGDGPQYYEGINAGGFVKDLFDTSVWNVWRNYFVWRQTPWAPPPDDALLYIPKSLATGTSAPVKGVTIPTVTVPPASQLVIGSQGSGNGQLDEPTDVSVDQAGNIYVSEGRNNRIQLFDKDGKSLRTFQPSGDAALNEPWSVAVAPDGSIYVSDTWNKNVGTGIGQVVKYDASFNIVWKSDKTIGLYGPRDILVLPDGNVLVADTGNKRIVKLSGADGSLLGAYGSDGTGQGQFNEPVGLALGPNGNIYVADTWNGRVQVFDSNFKYLTEFKVKGWGSQEVTAKPYLAVLPDGRVILGNPASGRIELYGGFGQATAAWELPAVQGVSGRPVGIALDGKGFLYVADCNGNRVYRLPVSSLTG